MIIKRKFGIQSPPMWGRGLKLLMVLTVLIPIVAPHVGAWIETILADEMSVGTSRPPCGGVD